MVKCSKPTALRWKKIPAAQRQRIQMVLFRESGMTQPAIAAVMGVSLSTANRAHMAYDDGGAKALKAQAEWRTQAREHDVGRRIGLLARFCQSGRRWRVLNIHDLKAAYRKRSGTRPKTARSTTCRTVDSRRRSGSIRAAMSRDWDLWAYLTLDFSRPGKPTDIHRGLQRSLPGRMPERPLVHEPCRRKGKDGGLPQILQ
jgi:hypothetical protein